LPDYAHCRCSCAVQHHWFGLRSRPQISFCRPGSFRIVVSSWSTSLQAWSSGIAARWNMATALHRGQRHIFPTMLLLSLPLQGILVKRRMLGICQGIPNWLVFYDPRGPRANGSLNWTAQGAAPEVVPQCSCPAPSSTALGHPQKLWLDTLFIITLISITPSLIF
jgi:hypothetical protein